MPPSVDTGGLVGASSESPPTVVHSESPPTQIHSSATSERSRLPIERLGDYRIIREIGRGGMGVVYEAEQESLGRRVALKVLPAGVLATSSHLARFEREAKAAARLHHTNIVPVYGVGRQDGLHYYVMQFIEGCGLDRVIEELRRQRGRGDRAGSSDRAELPAATELRDFSAADATRTLATPGASAGSVGRNAPAAGVTDESDVLTELLAGQRPSVERSTGLADEPAAAPVDDDTEPGDGAAEAGLATVSEEDATFVEPGHESGKARDSGGEGPAGDVTIGEEDFPTLDADGLRTLPEFTLPAGDLPQSGDPDATAELAGGLADESTSVSARRSEAGELPAAAESIPRGGARGSDGEPVAAVEPAGASVGNGRKPVGPVAGRVDGRTVRQAPFVTLPGESSASERGDPQKHYWRSVARVGVQVADALAYAHRNGTLHRDVKPANLLLDRHGRVWVTDFGLAKAAGSEDLTQTGDIVGTIRYMAPERFEGASDGRSDVYSLGLTLYELLARRPAYDESGRNQLIAQVMKHAPPALTSIDPAIPRDLATVVHKTIERDPAHRYQTARELADDLGRFLDDRPIQARRARVSERLWRWSRRNPALAGLTGAVLALLVMLAVGSFWAAMHFRDQVARTEDALREVRRQRSRAEENFHQARAAVEEALVRISENELLRAAGFQPLRKELLAASLKYYRWFVAQRADDPTLRDDLAASYFRLGEITAEIGQTAEALAHFRQAQTLREQLVEQTGQDSAAGQPQVAALARAHLRIGELQHALGRHPLAIESFEAARDLWRRLDREGYEKGVVEPSLAATFNGAGRVLAEQGNPTEALHCYREALSLLKQHAARDARHAEVKHALSRVHSSIGSLERRIGLTASALASCRAARDALVELVAAHPQHRLANQFREDLAACHEHIGDLLDVGRDTAAALEAWRESLAVRERLARDNPAVVRYQESLPHAYTRVCVLCAERQEWDEALRHGRLAERHWDLLPPSSATGLYDRARVQALRATAAANGRAPEAGEPEELAAAAVAALERAVQAGFEDVELLTSEPVFASLHAHRDFTMLVRRLQGARQAVDWTDNFESAKARATREGKDLFVYFSGEGWCPWCAMLRNGVFNEPEFIDHVPERFVMVQLDAPEGGPGPASSEVRERLRRRWGLKNMVPRIVLCDAAGRPYFEMSRRPTTAGDWVEFLDRLQEIRAERDRELSRAGTLAGIERARALDAALTALMQNPAPPRRTNFISDTSTVIEGGEMDEEAAPAEAGKLFVSEYHDIVREIMSLDGRNEAGLKAKYEKLVQSWWVAGPYPGELAAAYPPERATDPDAPVPEEGVVPGRAWVATVVQPGGAINFQELIGKADHASAYALTFIDSPDSREAAVLAGSDDTLRLWLNGDLVHEHPTRRAAAARQDYVPVTLRAGRNVLLAKVVNVDRNHLLYCQLSHDPLDLAQAWWRKGQSGKAGAYYDQAVAADPRAWRPLIERGGFFAQSERWDEAERDFEAALASGAERRLVGDHIGRVCYYAGRRHDAAGRPQAAARAYRRAVDELTAIMRESPSSSFQGKLRMCRQSLIYALARTDQHEELDGLVAASEDPATAANDLAWRLSTSEKLEERNPELAVKFARQAVERSSGDGAHWNTLGAAEYRAGHWDDAVAALTRSMELRGGGDSHDWLFLAMTRWHQGNRDEAHAWYRKAAQAFAQAPADAEVRRFLAEAAELLWQDDLLQRGRARVTLGQFEQALGDFSAVLEQQPQTAAALVARGDVHARLTRWQPAADDFAAALEIDPSDHWQWYRSACLRLKLGDTAGYLQHCREMLERFGDTETPYIAERVAKICLLAPEGAQASGEAPYRLSALAAAVPNDDPLYPYFILVKGIADYRAGRFAEAATACRSSFELTTNAYPQSLAASFCAMAYHRAGEAAEAQRWLTEADRLLESRLPKEASGNVGGGWHDWIMPHVVREEAARMMSEPSATSESGPAE